MVKYPGGSIFRDFYKKYSKNSLSTKYVVNDVNYGGAQYHLQNFFRT